MLPGEPSPFEQIDGFPGADAFVTEIAAGGPGFVAVGYQETGGACDESVGRAWTSPDGLNWSSALIERVTNVRLVEIVAFSGSLYAFGDAYHCAGDRQGKRDVAATVWRSVDGVRWERIRSGLGSNVFAWMDVAATSTHLVASATDYKEDDESGVRLSEDGIAWRAATDQPETFITSLATVGDEIAAIGSNDHINLGAAFSSDGGWTWADVSIDGGYWPWQTDLGAGHGKFIVVGRGCCALPREDVGLAMTSADGTSWAYPPREEAHAMAFDHVFETPTRFVVVSTDGSTAVSADGAEWFAGPPAPILNAEFRRVTASASGEPGIVIVDEHYVDTGTNVRAWFAPMHAFDGAWATQLPEPVWPEIGTPYPVSVGTHCGLSRIWFGGQTWLPNGAAPQFLDNPTDEGTFLQQDADHALYTSNNGGSVPFLRSDDPPPLPICY